MPVELITESDIAAIAHALGLTVKPYTKDTLGDISKYAIFLDKLMIFVGVPHDVHAFLQGWKNYRQFKDNWPKRKTVSWQPRVYISGVGLSHAVLFTEIIRFAEQFGYQTKPEIHDLAQRHRHWAVAWPLDPAPEPTQDDISAITREALKAVHYLNEITVEDQAWEIDEYWKELKLVAKRLAMRAKSESKPHCVRWKTGTYVLRAGNDPTPFLVSVLDFAISYGYKPPQKVASALERYKRWRDLWPFSEGLEPTANELEQIADGAHFAVSYLNSITVLDQIWEMDTWARELAVYNAGT